MRVMIYCLLFSGTVKSEGIPPEYLEQRRWFGKVLSTAKVLTKEDEQLKSAVEHMSVTSIPENHQQSWSDCRLLIESGDSRLVSLGVLVAGTFGGLDEWLKGFGWELKHAEGLVFAMEEMLPLVEGQNLGEGGASLCFRADFYIGTLASIFGAEAVGPLPTGTAVVREWVVAELDKLWQVVDDAKSKNELRAWIALIRDSPRATEVLELNDEIKAMIIRGESVTQLIRKRVYPPERPLLDGFSKAGVAVGVLAESGPLSEVGVETRQGLPRISGILALAALICVMMAFIRKKFSNRRV